MRRAIRHHGVAVADAAGDAAFTGRRGGSLLRTECVERSLILVAGYRADLTGRTGLPHPPDLQPGRPRFAPRSRRSGCATRAGNALGALRPLQTLRAGNAGLAAWARRSLWALRS